MKRIKNYLNGLFDRIGKFLVRNRWLLLLLIFALVLYAAVDYVVTVASGVNFLCEIFPEYCLDEGVREFSFYYFTCCFTSFLVGAGWIVFISLFTCWAFPPKRNKRKPKE